MTEGSKTLSKAAGGAKGVATALAGYPGIFNDLAKDHGEVSMLMSQVVGTFDDAPAREDLFLEIRKNLLAHARGEEEAFYPRLRRYPELESLVIQCQEDHDEMKEFLERLSDMEKSADGWLELFKEMKAAVETHVSREENELFPKARDLLDGDEAKEMQQRFEEVEEAEKSRL